MPSITRETALKLNAQAPSPWKFDVRYYVTHGEKTIIRHIELDAGRILEARLWFCENYNELRSDYGQTFRVPAGHYHIGLHIMIWSPSVGSECYHSTGCGKFINLDHAQHAKRNYKDLCKIAPTVTDEDILTYANVKKVYDDLQLLQLPS